MGTMGCHPAKKACSAQHADNLSAISPAACREAPRLSVGSSAEASQSGEKKLGNQRALTVYWV